MRTSIRPRTRSFSSERWNTATGKNQKHTRGARIYDTCRLCQSTEILHTRVHTGAYTQPCTQTHTRKPSTFRGVMDNKVATQPEPFVWTFAIQKKKTLVLKEKHRLQNFDIVKMFLLAMHNAYQVLCCVTFRYIPTNIYRTFLAVLLFLVNPE